MDLRQLKQFVVLATELNYRKAAERLNMTQPPLSIAIKKLEAEIGTPLFERDRLGVRLTVAGGAFLGEARRLLDGAESALAITRDAAQGRIGTLRVCAVPSASLNLLPKVLPVFTRRYPQIRLRLTSGSTVGILAELQRDELDAAFLVPPASRVPGADMISLAPQRLILAVPADHWAAGKTAISLSELGDETLVTLAHSDSPGFAGSIAATCRQAGFHPRFLQESSHALISLPLVAAGHGIAIVPEAHRRIAIENVAYVDVSDGAGRPLTYPMSLAVREHSPNPAVAPFIETVRDILAA